jgi:hypothetical protein
MTPSSFDKSRDRLVPTAFDSKLGKNNHRVSFSSTTLLVAVKPDCFGCRDFVQSDLSVLTGCDVVIISRDEDLHGEWREAPNTVHFVDQDVFDTYDIRWPPFYLLIDNVSGRVLTEGVVFGPSQVEEETRAFRVV